MNREGTRPWPGCPTSGNLPGQRVTVVIVRAMIALYVIPAKAGMTWERGVGVDSRYLLSQAEATRVSVMNIEVPIKNDENAVFGIIDVQDDVRGELVEP
ncbi:MAG: hypothetical protein MUP21_04455 [Dehalococcoidia bacterium]|nr:hypothetical protein [Dehalococcoidia bacterium]